MGLNTDFMDRDNDGAILDDAFAGTASFVGGALEFAGAGMEAGAAIMAAGGLGAMATGIGGLPGAGIGAVRSALVSERSVVD